MAKLTIKTAGVTPRTLELQPGVNKIGRAFSNDFQINAPSISSHHCEIILSDLITVKDLNSTNGTFIDGQKITEQTFNDGQMLRLGDVEIEHEQLSTKPAAAAQSTLRVAVARPAEPSTPEPILDVPIPPPLPIPATPPRVPRFIPANKSKRPRAFYQNILSAFQYPLHKDGLFLLVCGAIFFGILAFLRTILGGGIGAVGLLLGLFSVGYIFSYMQVIISSSAIGDDDMPLWPDFINWWDSGVHPSLQFFGIMFVCLGPFPVAAFFLPEEWEWVSLVVLALGALYLPMALLAVTMSDSLFALNPMTVILSILRVPAEYTVLCIVLSVVVTISFVLTALLQNFVNVAFIPTFVGSFLSLYFWTVQMRLVGLLYYSKREELGWGF